jgi:hypothetical protein
VVSMLGKHVSMLEKKVKSAYHIAPTQWFIYKHVVNLFVFFLQQYIEHICSNQIHVHGLLTL